MINIPLLLVFIPVVAAIIIYIFKNRWMYFLAFAAQILVTVLAVAYTIHYWGDFESAMLFIGGWSEGDIGISLRNDPLSISFLFLSIFSWWMVLIYKFEPGKTDNTFLFFLMFLQGVFLGLLQTNDLFNLFVFLELTTIIVTILVAYQKVGSSIRAGVYYLLLNTAGALAFLVGVILLYNVFGTINIEVIRNNMAGMGEYNIIQLAFVLMMAAVTVKAALFPVFTWLPKAHGVAQSAISALLSGMIVKAGIYLFIRLNQMFALAEFGYQDFFFAIGVMTAVTGAVFAMMQTNIKLLLAYSTLSQVGIIIIGLVSMETYHGGLLHVFNHALFKSLLFLGAGIIISVYRTKDITKIRGLWRSMPVVSLLMIAGMLAISGAPFFNGYVSKAFISTSLADSTVRYYTFFLINIGSTAAFIKLAQIFFGPKMLSYPMRHTAKMIPLFFIAAGCFALGNFYVPIFDRFFGVDLSDIRAFSLSAFFDYFVTLAAAFAIVWFWVRKDGRIVRELRKVHISFETANYMFVLYIVALGVVFVVW